MSKLRESGIDLELFKRSATSLRKQGMRTFLTTLGVVIGIAAIVALIAVGQGLNTSVQEEFEKMGSNTIIVLPGANFTQSTFASLEENDPKRIESINGVEDVFSIYFKSKQVEFEGVKRSSVIMGLNPEKQEGMKTIGMLGLKEGRDLADNEKFAVLLGERFQEESFENDIQIKQRLLIEGKSYKVVGINESGGSSFGSMFDNAIVMPKEGLDEISEETLTPFRIIVKVYNKEDIPDVKKRITKVLEKAHGEEDFQIMTASQIQESAGAILGLVQAVLVGIAAISLAVGSIGIMNTMFMSTMERTREIGIMKAIGATNKHIRNLFLIEAGFIGAGGGIIGVGIGFVIALVVGVIADVSGFPLRINPDIVLFLGAVLFAMSVGMIAGYIPAKRASEMDPVDALGHD